jgi:ankyrin repeat protein
MGASIHEIVRTLLARGADINAKDKNRGTALLAASDPEVVRTLLIKGADRNAKDEEGNTALMNACLGRVSRQIIQILLSAEVDINVRNKAGMTALNLAADNGLHGVEKLLKYHGARQLV